MGEVAAADALMESLFRLYPDTRVILSTMTRHGHERAARLFSDERIRLVYAPIDFFLSVRRSLQVFCPDILVFMETELWPNWIMSAYRQGVRIALLNGRISDRSFRRYLKIRPLMAELLGCISGFSMIHDQDADRIRRMGAPGDRVEINGNAKYDRLLQQTGETQPEEIRRLLLAGQSRRVFLAGSVRQEEFRMVIEVFDRLYPMFPDLMLVLAPRHLGRLKDIERELSGRSLRFRRRTDLDCENRDSSIPVVLLDSMGELQAAYSIAEVVFCGGSLVPKGGQNIMEPAAWAKPVLYGPYMDDFRDAREMLEGFGGHTVADTEELYQWVRFLLQNPDQARSMGSQARSVVERNRGSAQKHVRFLEKLWKGTFPPGLPNNIRSRTPRSVIP
jgi:3-deoxy-D-manno-octulosonic-acid transferase